jgi:hypothetical protein
MTRFIRSWYKPWYKLIGSVVVGARLLTVVECGGGRRPKLESLVGEDLREQGGCGGWPKTN